MLIYPVVALTTFLTDYYIKDKTEKNEVPAFVSEKLGAVITLKKYHNTGAFMGFLKKNPKMLKAVTASLLFALLMFYICALGKEGRTALKIGLSLLLGGAAGNAYDRFFRGYVVDWFSFKKLRGKKLGNIVFNLSDMALFAGTLLIILDGLFIRE